MDPKLGMRIGIYPAEVGSYTTKAHAHITWVMTYRTPWQTGGVSLRLHRSSIDLHLLVYEVLLVRDKASTASRTTEDTRHVWETIMYVQQLGFNVDWTNFLWLAMNCNPWRDPSEWGRRITANTKTSISKRLYFLHREFLIFILQWDSLWERFRSGIMNHKWKQRNPYECM